MPTVRPMASRYVVRPFLSVVDVPVTRPIESRYVVFP